MNRFILFFLTAWALSFFTLGPMALLLPPDPFTHLPFLPFAFGIPFVAAYWLVYRDGFSTIRTKLA